MRAGGVLLLSCVAYAHWKPSGSHTIEANANDLNEHVRGFANKTAGVTAVARPKNVRTGIFVYAAPFSGSTAMLQLLMSAGVATQCRNRRWECEEFRAWTPDLPVMKKLETLAGNWDLNEKNQQPLLFHKVGMPDEWSLNSDDSTFTHVIEKRPLPEAFTKNGIEHIDPHVILLWQPHCLHNYLSSHGARPNEEYIEMHQQFLGAYESLKEKNVDVTVVSFGDLIFKPDHVVKQLEHIPDLPKFDFDFVPTLGKDIFVENQFKAQGSVADYAIHVQQHEAAKHYDAKSGMCLGDKNAVQKLEFELSRAEL